jgi:uncharacterized repeat protein (TIGR03803 family)
MQKLRFAMYACLLAISCTFVLDRSASAVTETTLHAFTNGSDGGAPDAGLISDSKGSLYGTALDGGAHGYGTVYKLTHSASGWKETVLYNFDGGTGDGAFPAISMERRRQAESAGIRQYEGGAQCLS